MAALTGAHAIVLQGRNSGGYTEPPSDIRRLSANKVESNESYRQRLPLSEFIPATVEAITQLNLPSPPLIVAAGGISKGYDLLRSLELGADAICMGK